MQIDFKPAPTSAKFMASDAKMRVLMGPVGCIAGDTPVVTEEGAIPIERIDRPVRVLSWDETSQRYRLSPSGGAFPKGKDYLYRVTTLRGEFVAAGFHRVLCADRNYLPVESLRPGQSLHLCSEPLLESTCGGRSQSPEDVHRWMQTDVGYLASYAESARLRGQQLLHDEDTVLVSPPALAGVRRLFSRLCSGAFSRMGVLLEQSLGRNHHGQLAFQTQTGGYGNPVERLRLASVGQDASSPCARSEGTGRRLLRFLLTTARRWRVQLSCVCLRSYRNSVSDGTIISVERLPVKQVYWDMQVLNTNNYVTADGTVHHNSGKSVTSCFEIVRRASLQEPDERGVRKTRALVVRETARQLMDTTIKTWLDWFPEGVCGRYMRTTKTYFFKVGDVECEVMFRALDDADDVANLNSLELTFAWMNECRDIHPEIVDALSKRVGRFPSKKDGGPTWFGMWGDTNPPTMETWWYYQMEGLNPEDGVSPNDNGWDVFKQPSGRSHYAENIENLPEGYYDTQGRSEEYIRVYIDGEYGLSSAGTPVYKYFRPDYHMAKETIRPIQNGLRPLIVGMDLGLTPAAVVGQQDARGRALILAECYSFDMGVKRFVRTMLKPLLYERFSGLPVMIVVDPAGTQRAQTDERRVVDIIRDEGFKVISASTNAISPRINAVDDFLMRQVDGDPAFLVDPSCNWLKSSMMGGYRFRKDGEGIEKGPHSHIAEALQYLMLHIGNVSGSPVGGRKREVKPVMAAGWT